MENIMTAHNAAIRPFHLDVPEEELTELRRRINATRWPDRETVADQTQGVQLATVQALARYWATKYDWRKCQARLNALPQFITEIDGLDIHFIHVRSKHDNALPLIVTHGWPGSVVEQLKIVEPLTNPTAPGGSASDAFHLVIPSMPGYGYSGKPTAPGWDPVRIARAWVVLMKRLGYTKFVAQGGDWGAVVVDMMGVQAPPELLGIHSNMPGIFPADIDAAAFSGAPAPSGLSADEKVAYERLQFVYQKGIAYGFQMGLRPQTLCGITDSPVGLAAYFLDRDARSYELIARAFDGQSEGLTRDDILDNITITWLTNTALSGARLYWSYFQKRCARASDHCASRGGDQGTGPRPPRATIRSRAWGARLSGPLHLVRVVRLGVVGQHLKDEGLPLSVPIPTGRAGGHAVRDRVEPAARRMLGRLAVLGVRGSEGGAKPIPARYRHRRAATPHAATGLSRLGR
jgi:pimeloyl-ACP methyl ester carboxylesterase